MSFHKDIVGPDNVHVPHEFEYADAAARLAATGFVTADLKKLALQLDNFSLWILTATTPTWSEVTSTGSDTLAEILAGGNTSGGSDLIMSDGDTLDLQGNTSAMILNRLTTVERDALTPVEGMKIYNTTTNEEQTYNGSTWVAPTAGSGDVIGPGGATSEALARFDSTSGKLLKNSNALLTDAGALTIVGTIFSETRKVSTNPALIVEIFSAADFDALATAGVITVPAGTNLDLRIKAFSFSTATRVEVEAGAQFTLEGNRLSTIIYTGAGTFLTGTSPSMRLVAMNLTAIGGGTLFSVASLDPISAQVTVDRCVLVGWHMGAIDRTFVLFTSSIVFNWESGLTATNVRIFGASGLLFGQLDEVAVTDSLFHINTHNPKAVINIVFATGRLPAGDFFFKIDPAFHNEARFVVGSSVITGDMFDTSGITGAFTGVSDATIGATVINSVIDSPSSPGIARFNFTPGPTVFVNQYVELSGFAHAAYNQNGLVTAAGVGWFEVLPIQTGPDQAGSFRSDSITLAEAATTATDGLGITIDTDGATNYDGGAIVYNKQPGSFEIHRVWGITHTGSWSAEGLDQTDPRIISQGNPGQTDSDYQASAFVNANVTANPLIVNTVYRDMAFGTPGSALVVGSSMERWKLIDDVLGIFEYEGNEPFDGAIAFSQTSQSAGGAVEFRWKWVHDTGGGYVDLPDPAISSNDIGAAAGNTSFVVPLSAVKGDRIKPQVTRMTGASTITLTFASIQVQ